MVYPVPDAFADDVVIVTIPHDIDIAALIIAVLLPIVLSILSPQYHLIPVLLEAISIIVGAMVTGSAMARLVAPLPT